MIPSLESLGIQGSLAMEQAQWKLSCMFFPCWILFCVGMEGGTLLPGSEPTVDTVSVQPIPAYWYYVMAAGGAVLVLVSVALALVLHYHRFRYAAKKSDHSITYKTSHYANGAPLAVEPTLTIKLEQDRSSHC